MMVFCRSLLFSLSFMLWTILVSISYTVILPFCPAKVANVGRVWAAGSLWLLRVLCGITYRIEGQEDLPKGPVVFASKHQSTWDTMIFLVLFHHPAFVLKKELLNIPFYGKYLRKMEMIAIDRKAGASALKLICRQAVRCLKAQRSIVLFPEGTRVLPGKKRRYQPGISALYMHKSIQAPLVPVVLNSGLLWRKGQFLKRPGVITMRYLPPIPKGLAKKQFMTQLEEVMERASEALV